MFIRKISLAFAFAFTILTAVEVSPADTLKVDPAHSSINFRAQHVKAGFVYGRFNKFEGTITTDADPSKMKVEASVQTDSIDTGNAKRDTHLKSPDFFSAKEFSTISFKSTAVKAAGDNKYEVTGDLMLHGVTKPITITLTKTGESSMMGQRTGFLSTFTVKRSEFGMNTMPEAVSDEIELTVAFEAVKG